MLTTLLVALDLAGTFVFALSGALVAVRHRLDLFGILVLAFAAGNSGGMARDIMIGAIPPAAISDGRYVAVSVLAGLVTFLWHPAVHRLGPAMLLFDAAGLALFAVAGTGKALAFHAGPVAAALLGMLTGIGGGIVRDVLVREVPTVLQRELYAVAALAGAAVVVIGRMWSVNAGVSAAVGAALCFCLRLLAIRYGWHLPAAKV
ncbi:MAG: trimeric intracellular cation channel family protein [Bryobacterales bacterium]|nr:trimeric intracellular cation channel family protein [Bryobacterales bacterium]